MKVRSNSFTPYVSRIVPLNWFWKGKNFLHTHSLSAPIDLFHFGVSVWMWRSPDTHLVIFSSAYQLMSVRKGTAPTHRDQIVVCTRCSSSLATCDACCFTASHHFDWLHYFQIMSLRSISFSLRWGHWEEQQYDGLKNYDFYLNKILKLWIILRSLGTCCGPAHRNPMNGMKSGAQHATFN